MPCVGPQRRGYRLLRQNSCRPKLETRTELSEYVLHASGSPGQDSKRRQTLKDEKKDGETP